MNQLSKRERELVALGAAIGSNCVSCVEFHIPEARAAGLTDLQIGEAVELADAVRLVSARHALTMATTTLATPAALSPAGDRCDAADHQARRCC